MYKGIKESNKHIKGYNDLLSLSDWNSIVEEGKVTAVTGNYGLGDRNWKRA